MNLQMSISYDDDNDNVFTLKMLSNVNQSKHTSLKAPEKDKWKYRLVQSA